MKQFIQSKKKIPHWREIWTDEEEDFLRREYPKQGSSEEVCSYLKRNKSSIGRRASVLGLLSPRAQKNRKWTDEERVIFNERYPVEGPSEALQSTLRRTRPALVLAAAKMKTNFVHWSTKQERLLKDHYSHEGASDFLAKKIGKSKCAIHGRAYALDIHFNNRPLPWTKQEEDLLRERYPTGGASKSLQMALKRNRNSIMAKANGMNLYVTRPSGVKNSSFTGCGSISGHYIAIIRRGARERDYEFNLTAQYLWDLLLRQESKCALSCLPLFFPESYHRASSTQTASLDRIDSTKGYIEGNVQWTHKNVNKMKHAFTQQDFINYCNNVAKCHPR